jgi:uncharacterized delta-60 repeat protein
MLAGGCLLVGAVAAVADIGAVVWQQKYNPASSSWNNGFFWSVGFNKDGSILASGFRGEADSDSAIGVRYNALTGAVVDTPQEWFLFEYSWSDYAHDRFHDQHIDSNGNIYFVGMSYAASWNLSSSRYNVPNIWKFSSSYNNPPPPDNPDRPLWRKYHVGTGTATEENGRFDNMAVDSSDNIYAVGYYTETSTNRDWIIDKYDSDGNRATGYPLSHDKDGLHDYAYDVAVDGDNNFIVVGSVLVDAATDHYNWVVRKYESNGTLLWQTEYDLADDHDQALYVAVDSDDNVIVSGYLTNAAPASDKDWYIVKYAKDGDGLGGATIMWDKSWDDGSSRHGLGYEMALGNDDNIYIIGIQLKTSVDPAYTDRYRGILQYRDGETGALLNSQDIVLDATVNNKPALEHDYLRRLALKGGQLVIGGYTQQDGGYAVTRGRTGRVVMLHLPTLFKDGFE